MAVLSQIEKGAFLKLFNRSGYVLDFSTNDFDTFTLGSVGVALCDKYQMSKGRSLTAFVGEASDTEINKLFKDLFEHYELYFESEYNEEATTYGYQYNREYANLYRKCKAYIQKIDSNTTPLEQNANTLKEKFSSDYLSKQIDLMLKMQTENPTEAIGKAKELIESCCKTILEDMGITYDKNWDVGQLAGKTLEQLKLMPNNIPETAPASIEMKAILGNLRAIATNLAALRNPYGSGHGKSASFKGLETRHAKLAVGSSITFVGFLWDTHEKRNSNGI